MAVVKGNYVRRGRGEKARAKATIRYIQHRPGKDGERITRTLFGSDGVIDRQQAYRMIDKTKRGTIFFRIVLSPDPKREDRGRDLDLWTLTTQTMQALEERLKKEVQWIAVEHSDHTANRHIHALVLVRGRLTREDFQALRQAATGAALIQRQERDLAQERTRVRPARFQTSQAKGSGGQSAGGSPAPNTQTCRICWYREAEKLSGRWYLCPFCGLQPSRKQSVPLLSKEAQWDR